MGVPYPIQFRIRIMLRRDSFLKKSNAELAIFAKGKPSVLQKDNSFFEAAFWFETTEYPITYYKHNSLTPLLFQIFFKQF